MRRPAPGVGPGRIDRFDLQFTEQAGDSGRRPALQQRPLHFNPFDGDAPTRVRIGIVAPKAAAGLVVVGVVGFQLEQLALLEVNGDLHLPLPYGRQVEITEQAGGLPVGGVKLQPNRSACRLEGGGRDPDAVAAPVTKDELPEGGG